MKKILISTLTALLVSACAFGSAAPPTDSQHAAEIESLRERARSNDIDAMYLLVEMVTEMAPRYEEEAEFWLRRAALLGDEDAPRMLAEMLLLRNDENGFDEAIKLMRSIYKPRDAQLAQRIGSAYADKGYTEESIGWLQLSASEGDLEAAIHLSDIYHETERVRSSDLSVYWACRAISIRNDNSFIIRKLRERVATYGAECTPR
jgi:TPR repeat protein